MKKLSIKNNTLIQSVNFLHFLNKKGDLVKANIIDYHLEEKMQLFFKRKEIDMSQNLKHNLKHKKKFQRTLLESIALVLLLL